MRLSFLVPREPSRPGALLRFMVLLSLSAVAAVSTASACDICAVYTATELQESRNGVRVGIAQQITSFTTLQVDGDEVPNPRGERMTSAITQLLLGYQLSPRLGLQLTAPWIHRDFRRARGASTESGSESGFGDLSLLGTYAVASAISETSIFRLTLLGGVKLPTGSADRLREESLAALDPNEVRDRLNENMGPWRGVGAPVSRPQAHLGPADGALSGIHGHDLALGTGSTDPIFGLQALWTWKRAVIDGAVKYVLRTSGKYDYEYADEITASLNPGAFILLDDRHSLVLQLASTLDYKGKDSLDGRHVDDTALTAMYLGPGLHFTRGSALSLDFIADVPVWLDNSALQIVPDFRLRAGFVWRF